MRHPRLLLPASLVSLALAACNGSPPASTTEGATTDTGTGTTGDTPTTSAGTAEPQPPELPKGLYALGLDDSPPSPIVLDLDRAGALEFFGDEAARDIKLIDVGTDALLADVLDRIQNSCGTTWKSFQAVADDKLPQSALHNCSLTELGKTYGPDWKTSPQYAMVRLLTMTPRNGNVAGTALGSLWSYFHNPEKLNNAFGLSFEDILAASLSCPDDPNDPNDAADCVNKLKSTQQAQFPQYKKVEEDLHMRTFIPLGVLSGTLKRTLMASHPNIANDSGKLPVSMYDALHDMAPLADKFGPVGEHPGLLMPDDADGDGQPEFATRSDAITPAFRMVVTADSNLRRVEGIDASTGVGEMFINPAGTPLALDFMDEDKVKLEGIADVPTIDMRMRIAELDTRVASCDEDPVTCKTNKPDSPLGSDYVWSAPLWSLERIVADAAYETYKDRTFAHCFITGNPCDALVTIGAGGDPPGWSVFDVKVGVTTPKPQYFWELLLDVAQTALHDFTGPDISDADQDGNTAEILPAANGEPELAEGQAAPIFALKQVPIGLTAEEMLVDIRATLQTQADTIGELIVGKYWKNNSHLDFFFRRGDDGLPYLHFIAPSDKRPHPDNPDQLASYDYANPGFFADAALTQKLSSTQIDGLADTDHEKFLLTDDATLYMQDDDGVTYRLQFFVYGATDVEVLVEAV